MYLLGETPARQLRPALDWLVRHRRARRWALIGNDYVWPRMLHDAAVAYLRDAHAQVVAARYVPLGGLDPAPLLDLVRRRRADAGLLAALAERAGSLHPAAIDATADGTAFAGGLYLDYYVNNSPQCAPDRVFSGDRCLATLDGTVTLMTAARIDIDVQGRPVSARISVKGRFPRYTGEAVRVTFFKGEVTRVEGEHIRVDAEDSVAGTRSLFAFFGTGFLIAGAVLGAAGLFELLLSRERPASPRG